MYSIYLIFILQAFFGLPYDSTPENDIIRITPYYIYSYNCETKLSNWVAWSIRESDYGDAPRRKGNFIKDTILPCSSPTHLWYTNTGFDRGNLVRSEERTSSIEANRSTFNMSNVLPQSPSMNRRTWYAFERYCEQLVREQGRTLYVVAGAIYGANSYRLNDMLIPIATYKAVIVCNDTVPIDTVCMIMPNEELDADWKEYVVPLDEVEMRSGYVLFKQKKP